MEKQIYFSKTGKISRVISLLLCFIIVFSFAGNTIVAKAIVAYDPAEAAIWAALKLWQSVPSDQNVVAQVLAKIIDAISDRAGQGILRYQNLSKMLSGLSSNATFKLTAEDWDSIRQVIFEDVFLKSALNLSHIQSKDEILIGANQSQMYVPTPEAMQDMLSISDLQILYTGFVSDTLLEIQETNSLLDKIRIFMGTSQIELKNALSNGFSNVVTRVTEEVQSLTYRLDDVKMAIQNTRTELVNSLQELKESVTYRIDNVLTAVNKTTTAINDFKSAIAYRIDAVKTAVTNLPTNLFNAFSNDLAKIKTSLTGLQEKLDALILDFPALNQTLDSIHEKIPKYEEWQILFNKQIFDEELGLDFAQDQLGSNSDEGKKKIPVVIGHGKDLLSKYSTAFLAVGSMLTKFLELPVIGDLVQFGLALGVFALVVNLANQLLTAEDKSGAKARPKRVAKGG